jgi:hypothetical protein
MLGGPDLEKPREIMKCVVNRLPVHGVVLVGWKYFLLTLEWSSKLLVMCPELYLPSGLRRHLLSPDEETNWFQGKHPTWHGSIHAICCNFFFYFLVTDAVKLQCSTQLLERHSVILMCLQVRVVCCEGKASAVNKDSFQNIGMPASRRDSVRQ